MQSSSKKITIKKIADALRKNLKKRKDFQNKLNNERKKIPENQTSTKK